VIAGQPNVGKSSLLNALAGAELAIVTPIPGTTRDKLTQTIQIEGVPVNVVDTAGLRDDTQAQDEVERIGIARAWAEIEAADAVLFLHDLTRRGEAAYDAGETRIAERLPKADARLVHVYNKVDLCPDAAGRVTGNDAIALSARTGAGLDALRHKMLVLAGWHAQPEGLFTARARHVQALRRAQGHLAEAGSVLASAAPAFELLAEELRLAHEDLGAITGQFSADDLLGQIFGSFCIGK
jgi:tRNA modification GTPase